MTANQNEGTTGTVENNLQSTVPGAVPGSPSTPGTALQTQPGADLRSLEVKPEASTPPAEEARPRARVGLSETAPHALRPQPAHLGSAGAVVPNAAPDEDETPLPPPAR